MPFPLFKITRSYDWSRGYKNSIMKKKGKKQFKQVDALLSKGLQRRKDVFSSCFAAIILLYILIVKKGIDSALKLAASFLTIDAQQTGPTQYPISSIICQFSIIQERSLRY